MRFKLLITTFTLFDGRPEISSIIADFDTEEEALDAASELEDADNPQFDYTVKKLWDPHVVGRREA